VTATGPRLSAGLRAPDQRPSTGVIGRYFLCCLRAGYGDARSRAPECDQRSCKVPLQSFLSATFSTADIYRTVRPICFVPRGDISRDAVERMKSCRRSAARFAHLSSEIAEAFAVTRKLELLMVVPIRILQLCRVALGSNPPMILRDKNSPRGRECLEFYF